MSCATCFSCASVSSGFFSPAAPWYVLTDIALLGN